MKISVVIPCLNEARSVGLLVHRLRAVNPECADLQILVVDNGSSDDSVQIAEQAGAEVIHCQTPGYGAALRFGAERARHDLVAIMDADLTYAPEDLSKLFSRFETENADLLLGDRLRGQQDKGAMPFLHRYLGTPVLSFALRLLYPGLGSLRDCNSGYRLFRKKDFVSWDLGADGMEVASEMIARAALQSARLVSVPIAFHKSPVERRPHLRPWRDGFRHLRTIFEIRLQSFTTADASPPPYLRADLNPQPPQSEALDVLDRL